MILPELFNVAEKMIVNQALCLNSRFRDAQCSKCDTICPHQSVNVESTKGEAPVTIGESCTGCGLCIGECPTRAISSPTKAHQPLIMKDGIADLFCTKLEKRGFVPCLGTVDAYALVYMGIKAKQVNVIIDNIMCESCNPGVVKQMKELISRANVFLDKIDRPNITIIFKSGNVKDNLSRRDLFSFCFSKVKETVAAALPYSEDKAEQTYRELLLKTMPHYIDGGNEHNGSSLFWGATVSDDCDVCGICVRTCKNAALTIKVDETQQKIELYHNQSKCIGCSVCSLICHKTAIKVLPEESSLKKIVTLLPHCVVSHNGVPCNRCGALIVPNEQLLCETCLFPKKTRLQDIY